MKIVASTIQLASQRTVEERHKEKESLRVWSGDVRPDFEGQQHQTRSAAIREIVEISQAAMAAQPVKTIAEPSVDDISDAEE